MVNPSLVVTQDTTTYNWPCVNTCLGRYKPTCLRDCPWLLLIVMAKHGAKGSCRLLSLNGHLDSFGDIIILGIVTFCPIFVPEMMSPLMDHLPRRVTINLVPLHRPSIWFRFLRSITGAPSLNRMSWLGMPLNFKLFKNSVGYRTSSSFVFALALHILSELKRFSLDQVLYSKSFRSIHAPFYFLALILLFLSNMLDHCSYAELMGR